MERFKSFDEFINEALGNDSVWKFDKKEAGTNEIANFEITARIAVKKGTPDQEVGDAVADYVTSRLASEPGFADAIKQGIPVIYTTKDKYRNDIFGVRQGVLKGVITVLNKKNAAGAPFYDEAKLSNLSAFKPNAATKELIVNGVKIFDGDTIKSAQADSGTVPNDPAAKKAEAAALPEPTAAAPTVQADQAKDQAAPAQTPAWQSVSNLIKDTIEAQYGQQSDVIASLQAILITMSPEAKALINAKGGPMGRFGDATAQSIAKILGKTEPVKSIDAATADALIAKIGNITPEQIEKVLVDFKTKAGEYAAAATAAQAKKATGTKSTKAVATTKKGTKLTFL